MMSKSAWDALWESHAEAVASDSQNLQQATWRLALGTADCEAEALAFQVAFIAGRHGVDPVWYARWLEPLVSPAVEPGYMPKLEFAVRHYLGNWFGAQ